jgi:CubicO group peptidase (beta-lactamase class C family)
MFSNTTLEFKPGTKTMYSNIGAGMLGHALQLATGVPYDQLLKSHIFDVLGMKDSGIGMNASTISIPDDIKQRFAKGHIEDKEVNLEFLPPLVQPSGAIYSTVNDLTKYLSANMGLIDTVLNGAMEDTHLIRHQFEDSSTGNFEDSSGHKSAVFDYIGLGWFIETNFGQQVVWHNGGIDGFSSWIGFNPEKKVGVVILCSCDSRDVPPSEMISVATPFLLFYPNY